jgi:hypothetical protein
MTFRAHLYEYITRKGKIAFLSMMIYAALC